MTVQHTTGSWATSCCSSCLMHVQMSAQLATLPAAYAAPTCGNVSTRGMRKKQLNLSSTDCTMKSLMPSKICATASNNNN